jgi:hypothetical protein
VCAVDIGAGEQLEPERTTGRSRAGGSRGKWEGLGACVADLPHLRRRLNAVGARPTVRREITLDKRKPRDLVKDEEARKILLGQTGAATVFC